MTQNPIRPIHEITELLEIYIDKNKLKPNDKLPSERGLCDMWSINRTTLRRALELLKEQGIVYSIAGKGYFVKSPKLRRNLQDMRPLVVLAEEQGKKLETVILKLDKIKSNKNVSEKLQISEGTFIWELIRLRYLDGIPSMIEYSYFNEHGLSSLQMEMLEDHSLYELLEKYYDIQLVKGEQRISLRYASREEANLLQISERMEVIFISGQSYTSKDSEKPFEHFISLVRPDVVKLSSILKV